MTDYGRSNIAAFYLDPSVLHLNHGAYGAVPRRVMAALQHYQTEAEARCSTFFRDRYDPMLTERLDLVARRYGGQGCEWVFVENATAACNAIFLSCRLEAGDEILFTSAIYGAVRNALLHWQGTRGITLTELPMRLPVEDPAQVVDLVRAALSPKVKLLVIDHVTSTSALRLPVGEIAALCRESSTRVLVDGAHGPGQIALDVPALGVDYYTGNAHKWHFAPKGCAMLWVRPGLGGTVHPTVISHGYRTGLHGEFNWIGTRDASAWFAFRDAVEAHDGFGGKALMRRNRDLAAEAGACLAEALGTVVAGPPEMQVAMSTILLPVKADATASERIQRDFSTHYAMETSFVPWEDRLAIRISAQVYNELEDYETLVTALKDYFDLS
ncbi:Isopenicillin N epimerase [Defluviimonas aquaemixtae]|uniref:Isopenicillin N epimerase n=1 Tax=Albidovulum aquaemixtae TaxID=1542388 RepID=A0A2R8BMD0_9RHOB|nr:aminotransferase class V-fold PLP-dependent enzyme [Defluviimonas aquaemixtae]SPH24566.1 Isopenicillin N epimerase [Defluviimonas aquaemixtae]